MRCCVAILVGIFGVYADAAVINVPGDQPTIQDAINVAVNGDEIIVAPGTYVENIDFLGKAITVRGSVPTDPAVVSATVIDGNAAGSTVSFQSGEGNSSVLEGVTVANGLSGNGGGIFANDASPTIRLCVIRDNIATNDGGGLYISGISPTVKNCVIVANSASGGGGLFLGEAGTILNCSITNNTAVTGGGVLVSAGFDPQIGLCIINDNVATGDGGGMYVFFNVYVMNCYFAGNVAAGSGGAITFDSDSGASLYHCVFSGNTASSFGGGVFFNDVGGGGEMYGCTFSGNQASEGGGLYLIGDPIAARIEVAGCIIWGNSATSSDPSIGGPMLAEASYDIIEGGYPGNNMVVADPLFVDANGDDDIVGTPDDNLRPGAVEAVDTGINGATYFDLMDFDNDGNITEVIPFDIVGNARYHDGNADGTATIDIGAYESTMVVDCNQNGVLDSEDIASGNSPDFNDNGIPDECEPDCNLNGLPDFIDIAFHISDDCNLNTVPDECELSDGTSFDCNANSVLDECDIASLFSTDLNLNGIPDDCECLGDLSGNSVVNVTDLLLLLEAWGLNPGHVADITGDGNVNVTDLLILLSEWGAVCP